METKNIHIRYKNNGGEINFDDSNYLLDGWCEENQTIYEYHGCYWHGCNRCFKQESFDLNQRETFARRRSNEIYQRKSWSA